MEKRMKKSRRCCSAGQQATGGTQLAALALSLKAAASNSKNANFKPDHQGPRREETELLASVCRVRGCGFLRQRGES
ncbi:hypothetical protein GN956_G7346 [Arapaima gigas]